MRLNGYKYRFIDQPNGWLGGTVKPDFLTLVNLRLDPFERTGLSKPLKYYDFRIHEFWRIVFVQQEVAQVGETFVKFPPRQKGASFNFEVVKEQIFKAVKAWATK